MGKLFVLYFTISGLITWFIVQPSTIDWFFERWCKKHKDDADYIQNRQLRYTTCQEFRQEQWAADLSALIFGWILLPSAVLYKILKLFGVDLDE